MLRLAQDHYRVVDGAGAGHRDLTSIRRMAQDRGAKVTVTDTTTEYGCLGLWGPNARTTIQKVADEPEAWELTQEQTAELDRRLATHKDNPKAGSSWDEVKARLRDTR